MTHRLGWVALSSLAAEHIADGVRGNQGVSWGSSLLMDLAQAWERQSWGFFLLLLCAFLHSWGG